MTQPTGPAMDKKEHDRLKGIMEKGAKTTLDIKRRFPAPAVDLEPQSPITVEMPGAEALTKEMGGANIEIHLLLAIEHTKTPEFAALVFLNTPQANQDTPIDIPGYAGALAFFGPSDDAQGHHGPQSVRLPVTATIKKLGTPESFTATLVPIAYPGRRPGRNAAKVTASLEVVVSKVVKN